MYEHKRNPFCPHVFTAPAKDVQSSSEEDRIKENWLYYWQNEVEFSFRCAICNKQVFDNFFLIEKKTSSIISVLAVL